MDVGGEFRKTSFSGVGGTHGHGTAPNSRGVREMSGGEVGERLGVVGRGVMPLGGRTGRDFWVGRRRGVNRAPTKKPVFRGWEAPTATEPPQTRAVCGK